MGRAWSMPLLVVVFFVLALLATPIGHVEAQARYRVYMPVGTRSSVALPERADPAVARAWARLNAERWRRGLPPLGWSQEALLEAEAYLAGQTAGMWKRLHVFSGPEVSDPLGWVVREAAADLDDPALSGLVFDIGAIL